MFDAVNNKEYYNVAPGGLSRPDGFVMSDNEINKIGYLKNMMNNEILYGVKMEDTQSVKGLRRKIMLTKYFHDENGLEKAILYHIADDTWDGEAKYIGDINVKCEILNFKYPRADQWLFVQKGYMIIPEYLYDKYRFRSIENHAAFMAIKEEIEEKYQTYIHSIQKASVIKDTNPTVFNNHKDPRRSNAYNCIAELAKKSKDYSNMIELINKYEDLGLVEVYHAVTGSGSMQMDYIKSGKLKCSGSQIITATKILEYERRFIGLPIKGRRDYFNIALAFYFNCDEIDNEELYKRLSKNYHRMKPIQSVKQAVSEIERVYNYRNQNKVYIQQRYFNKKEKR